VHSRDEAGSVLSLSLPARTRQTFQSLLIFASRKKPNQK
jgi:hypothetical protein